MGVDGEPLLILEIYWFVKILQHLFYWKLESKRNNFMVNKHINVNRIFF